MAGINQFFKSVTNFFGGGDSDNIPWSIPDSARGYEREVEEARMDESGDRINESIMRLSWVLVHSRQPEDVQRGIAMLEAASTNPGSPLQDPEKLYLIAVGYYRSGEYERSWRFVDKCLEISPDWGQLLSLKKTVEEHIKKDGAFGVGITATAVAVLGAVAAALARRG